MGVGDLKRIRRVRGCSTAEDRSKIYESGNVREGLGDDTEPVRTGLFGPKTPTAKQEPSVAGQSR